VLRWWQHRWEDSIKRYLKKMRWVWTEIIWQAKELSLTQQWNFGFHKTCVMSWPPEDTWRLCSMELIGSNELERLCKEAVLPNLGHYSSSCLEGLKKVIKTSIIMASILKEIRNGTKDVCSRQTQVRCSNVCTNCSVGRQESWHGYCNMCDLCWPAALCGSASNYRISWPIRRTGP
jgi:hypothetical protein